MAYVYILRSDKTGRYYCGETLDLEDRINRHNSGRSKATKSGVPWKLVRVYETASRSDSRKLERKIKARGIQRYLLDH